MKAHPYWTLFFLAWLLWVHSSSIKKTGAIDNWHVDSTYESKDECEKGGVKVSERYDFMKSRPEYQGFLKNRAYKMVCLPQTVHPRDLKEKPKEQSKEESNENPK